MLLLSCRGIGKEFGELTVLKDIDLDISTGDRVGLVGINGAGKTTLAEILFGALKADRGKVSKYKDKLLIGYLRQSTAYSEDKFHEMVFKGNRLEMSDFLQYTSYLGLEQVQGWESDRFRGMSGGERTKLALARVWINSPEILILDEPTNHLDFNGINWLIEEIRSYRGAVVVISHDRYFLDQTVTEILELEKGRLTAYAGNYTAYRQEKKREYEARLHRYEEQLKKEKKLMRQINQLDNWADKAHQEARKTAIDNGRKFGGKEFYRARARKMDRQVKSRRKRLLKMKEEGLEKPQGEPGVNLDLTTPEKRGRRVIEARDIKKSYQDRVLFTGSSFYIQHGERLGVFGENGCGKSTLARAILGQVEVDQGEIWVSPSLKIGYLSQDVLDLDESATILEALGIDRGLSSYHTRARTMLANLGFEEAVLDKPLGCLSLGERTRIKLIDLVLQENDCLILDEPTNHLDLYCREELEETLLDYPGTLLIISHDRYLLEKLSDKMLIFSGQEIRRLERGFQEYYSKIEEDGENAFSPESATGSQGDQGDEKELMVIENRIAFLLAELERYSPEDPEYLELDREFKELLVKKKEIRGVNEKIEQGDKAGK